MAARDQTLRISDSKTAENSYEDDADVADSWEDLENTELLERDLEKLDARSRAFEKAEREKAKRIAKLRVSDNSIEGQYKPQVKILKRQVNENGQNENQTSRQTQVKPLEVRQEEYMKARERILGSAVPEGYSYSDNEDDSTSENSAIKTTVSVSFEKR